MVESSIPADDPAEAPPIWKECVLMLATRGNADRIKHEMWFLVKNSPLRKTNNGPHGHGWTFK